MSDINQTLYERGRRYGKFADVSRIAQKLKLVSYVEGSHKSWGDMKDDQKEALDMIFNKIGRILTGDPNYVDNWHDIAGYATLVEKRLNGESV